MNQEVKEIEDAVLCICGTPVTTQKVTRFGANMGRLFHCCPKPIGDPSRCDFFNFTDNSERKEENVDKKCLCALSCKMFRVKKPGPNTGKWFYCCGLPSKHPQRCDFWEIQGGTPYKPLKDAPDGVVCGCGEQAVQGSKRQPDSEYQKVISRCNRKKSS